MAFKVDPEALDQAAALLERNRQVVPDMQAYISRHVEKGAWNQIGGQGLLLWFSYDHDEQIARADHRLNWVNGVWQSGAVNFGVSAAEYRRIDAEAAARIDAELPKLSAAPVVDSDPAHWDYSDRPAATFGDVADPLRAVSSPPDEGRNCISVPLTK